MPKFFIKNNQIINNQIIILGEDVKHISNVLRKQIGEELEICNIDTSENYLVEIENILKTEIQTIIKQKNQSVAESEIHIHIFQGLPKSDKMELIIQKATELVEIILNGNVGVAKGEIDYFNDLGLCNIAEEKFEVVQQITMGAFDNEDNANPTYEQYRNAIVKELTDKNAYVIDDAHRELSELDRFQEEVNWHFGLDEEGYYTGSVYYTTETRKVTRKWKKTKTTTRTETTRTEKEITDEAKKEVDDEIAKENEEEKKKAEQEAEETRKEMQEEEDKKAEEIKEEIRKDDEDLQEKIDDANDKIEENQKIEEENQGKPEEEQKPTTPVNESDFGDHNVDFDDQHSDSEGNLNDSVENITTDGTGAKTPSDLPDPNATGKKFDEEGEKQSSSSNSSSSSSSSSTEAAPKAEAPKESAPAPKAEAPKESAPAPAPAPEKKSNEQIVDSYVEDLAKNSSNDDEAAKELHK